MYLVNIKTKIFKFLNFILIYLNQIKLITLLIDFQFYNFNRLIEQRLFYLIEQIYNCSIV